MMKLICCSPRAIFLLQEVPGAGHDLLTTLRSKTQDYNKNISFEKLWKSNAIRTFPMSPALMEKAEAVARRVANTAIFILILFSCC